MVPVCGAEAEDGTSKYNRPEAEAVAAIVRRLLQYGELRAADIGVISPYGAQVRILRSLLRSGMASRDPNAVEVSSVDGFQGREKEVIVFSCVRASQRGGLGFLADARRVNVAFTRAKRGLIVIGHPPTLEREAGTWAPWLRWARSNGE